MQKKAFVLFGAVGTKGTVEDQFIELVPQECVVVVAEVLIEPSSGFLFQGFELGRGDASLGGEKKAAVVVTETVVGRWRVGN